MDGIWPGVLIGVVSTVLGAAVLWLAGRGWLRVRRFRQSRNPVRAQIGRVVGSPWSVVTAARLPEETVPNTPLDGAAIHEWATNRGAVDIGSTQLRISLTTSGPGQVVVEQARAEIVQRLPSLTGVRYVWESAGMGDVGQFTFDLDQHQPVAMTTHPPDDGREFHPQPWFTSSYLTVEADNSAEVHLTASTSHNLVLWRVVFDLRVGTSRRVLVVDDDGEPFRTTGRPQTGYDHVALVDWADWYSRHGPQDPVTNELFSYRDDDYDDWTARDRQMRRRSLWRRMLHLNDDGR